MPSFRLMASGTTAQTHWRLAGWLGKRNTVGWWVVDLWNGWDKWGRERRNAPPPSTKVGILGFDGLRGTCASVQPQPVPHKGG
jgi:hypothetical protein